MRERERGDRKRTRKETGERKKEREDRDKD
jgi:hypothetical protein